jgi:hypothetical protein
MVSGRYGYGLRSTDCVVYSPRISPVEGRCDMLEVMSESVPYNLEMKLLISSRISLQGRAEHILQCQRNSLNRAPSIG